MLITASFIILVLQPIVFAQSGECDYASNCNVDEKIAHIQCTGTDASNGECKCLDLTTGEEAADCSYAGTLTGIDVLISDFSAFDLQKSIELCKDTQNAKCNFYKFIIFSSPTFVSKTLYLMETCSHPGDSACDEPTCSSGGVKCDEDHEATEAPPTGEGCSTSGIFHPSSIKDNYLHWYCTHPNNDITPNFVDDANKGMPIGTKCSAHHKCWRYPDSHVKKIDSYQLKYSCNAASEGEDGQWVPDNLPGYDEEVINGTLLQEPKCNADPLQFKAENFYQESLFITCTDGDVDVTLKGNTATVPAENHCLLLCDMYPILSFFVDWKIYDPTEQNIGERVWYYQYQIAGESPRQELTNPDDIISCWPPTASP